MTITMTTTVTPLNIPLHDLATLILSLALIMSIISTFGLRPEMFFSPFSKHSRFEQWGLLFTGVLFTMIVPINIIDWLVKNHPFVVAAMMLLFCVYQYGASILKTLQAILHFVSTVYKFFHALYIYFNNFLDTMDNTTTKPKPMKMHSAPTVNPSFHHSPTFHYPTTFHQPTTFYHATATAPLPRPRQQRRRLPTLVGKVTTVWELEEAYEDALHNPRRNKQPNMEEGESWMEPIY